MVSPSHSLLSLLPTASITPRNTPSNHLHLLPFHKTLRPQPLHASPSPSPSPAADDELHLLDKPSPSAAAAEAPSPPPSRDEALAPFLKFFQVKSTETGADDTGGCAEGAAREAESAGAARGRFGFRCYDPRPGDLVVGVVVGGDERTVDVDVGAGGEPALILAKEAVPLCAEEFGYLSCDVASEEAGRFAVEGKVGVVVRSVVQKGEVVGGRKGKRKGAPVVGVGTVVFAEVLGRTLGGRPLLSARRLFRRVAWLRVRQIKQLNIPIEVKIFEWNAGGLLSRIEGLRAFLPKPEMMTRPRNFTDLKNNVGRQIHVCVTRVDEGANELIVSEKEAWELTYLKEGSLLQGTVRKLFPYGAQIRIGETNRSGLLHISNISHGRVASISDVLKVDEEVKVLVVKSTVPDRIALSIKDLESEPGLFLSNKDKVFSEAEEMAQKYREQIPETSGSDELDSSCSDALPFDSEAESYANWKWLKFRKSDKVNCNSDPRLQHRISE